MIRLPALSPRIALVLAILAVSWGSILARLCASGPVHVSFYRVLFTALLASPFVLAGAGRRREPGADRIPGARTLAMTAGAGICLALHFATWIASLSHTSVGASVFLLSVQPVFAILLASIFLGERARGRSLAAIAVAMAGTALIAWRDLAQGGGAWMGDLLALAGAFFVAAYLLLARGCRHAIGFGPWLVAVSGGAAGALALLLALGPGRDGDALAADWPWLILMALGPGLAGHGLLNWSVRRIPAWVVNSALLGEPVLATLYAWWLFGERPGPALLAGGLLIGAGLAWIFREEGAGKGAGEALPETPGGQAL